MVIAASEMSFGRWFHLRDPERTSFELSPERDVDIWCGDQQILRQLHEYLATAPDRAPKLLFYGAYGTGKTHSLFHCKHILESQRHCLCLYIVWSGFSARTRFSDVFREVIKQLSPKIAIELCRAHFAANKNEFAISGELGRQIHSDIDLRQVLRILAADEPLLTASGALSKKANLAWRWLQCLPLNTTQRNELNVSASLIEDGSPTRLVNILRLFGSLLWEQQNRRLVLIFDEAEQAQQLRHKTDALNHVASATRALFDRDHQEIGILVAFFATNLAEQVLIRQDTVSRLSLTRQIIELRALLRVEQRIDFLEAVLNALVDPRQSKNAPLQTSALLLLAERGDQLDLLIEENPRNIRSSRGDFTPRMLLKALDQVTRAAYRDLQREITRDYLRQKFPQLGGV